MLGFLKDKLKSWIGKAKEKIGATIEKKESEDESEEKKRKILKKQLKPEITKPKLHKEKEIKQQKKEKRKKTSQELKEEREVTEKVITDIKKEELEIKTPEEKFEKELEKFELEKIEEQAKIEEQEREKEEELKKEKKPGFFERLKKRFSYKISESDFNEIFSDLEFSLLENNVALEVVEQIENDLKLSLIGKEIKKQNLEKEISQDLKNSLNKILVNPENIIEKIKEYKSRQKEIEASKNLGSLGKEPYKILFFGINGAGKTTSIAKFAKLLQKNNLSCVLAASDTFRAASIEQLQIHADKLKIHLIKNNYGSDPSAVAFDSIKYAEKNRIDVVLIDTAGRMHTKENLLKEMEKICRVTKPNLKVFVAESIAGNDATEQAKAFNDMIGIDGSILSKTDIDEKGGTILSISYVTKKPIFYLGTGQNYEDLELFDKNKFIERLGL